MFIQQLRSTFGVIALLALILTWVVCPQPLSAEAFGKITGKVVRKDAGAAPLAQVSVRVDSASLEAQTDTTGWYVIDHVPTGQHKLIAQRDGFLPTIIHTFEVMAKAIRVDIALEDPLSRLRNWNDTAMAVGVIGGCVRNKHTKQPVPFAVVQVDGTTMGAQANPNGVYQIRRVPTGTYSLVGHLTGWRSVQITNVVVKAKTTTQVELLLEESIMECGATVIAGEKEELILIEE